MNSVKKYKFLQFVDFANLFNWGVSHNTRKIFSYNEKYPLLKIGEIIKKNNKKLLVKDEVVYKRVTIKLYGKGVYLRDCVKGENIGTKNQFQIQSKQFIISKIDARNGAFGIVPFELDGAITTQDFISYNIDSEKINIDFLNYITATKTFLEICESASSGTTGRKRLDENFFLNIEIPIPTIKEQQQLVESYKSKVEEAHRLEKDANELEKKIDLYLLEELGIEFNKSIQPEQGKLFFLDFKDLTRWDVWNLKGKIISKKYDLKKFKNVVIGSPIYGANEKGVKKISDTRYIRITDINEDGSLNNEFVSPAFTDEKYLLKENDFLIARSGNTVGKTFLYKNKYGRAIYAGYLVKYILNSNIFPEFLFFYTKCSVFKNWISQNQRVSGQPNINGQEFLEFPLPIPSIKVQQKIAAEIEVMKTKQKLKIAAAENLKQEAIAEFERAIFN